MDLRVSGAPLTEMRTRGARLTVTIEMVDMRLSVDENWKRRRTLISAWCLDEEAAAGAILSSATQSGQEMKGAQ